MTLQEFIEARPQSYGAGNINLLYSSSVSGSDNTPIAPFVIEGISIPFTSLNGVNVSDALKEVETFRFDYPTGQVAAAITGRQQKNEYYYFTFTPISTNTLPTAFDVQNNSLFESSSCVFVPYITQDFNNSDYNPLNNNSEGSLVSPSVSKVDRQTSQFNPTNLDAINTGTATAAEIQESFYTTTGLINGKYIGSKTTSAGPISRQYNKSIFVSTVLNNVNVANEPTKGLLTFEGSIHADDATTTAIKAINNADREIVEVLFTSALSGSHPNKIFPNFPKVGNNVFTLDGNKAIGLVSRKIYAIDTDEVITTNNLGAVTTVE